MTEEYFNVKKAAAYCGYNDKYFGKLAAKTQDSATWP